MKKQQPKYALHKATGQARVRINGKSIYLGALRLGGIQTPLRRPGEVRLMRMRDIDMSGEVWEYRPQEHKTEHHGRQRLIFIGPKGQEIVKQFLLADPERYLFSPQTAEKERSEDRRMNRKTPMTPSQAARAEKADRRRKRACPFGS